MDRAFGVLLFSGLVLGTATLLGRAQSDQHSVAFEVASVKPNRSDTTPTVGFALGPGDAYVPNGRFVATNQPLIVYIRFAYKLAQSDSADLLHLPAWVYDERFDIAARAEGLPTKDQMRRMMQALLGERFKLRAHTERRTQPVFALTLVKSGTIGPQLRKHKDDETSCASEPSLHLPPIPCGTIGPVPAREAGRARLVANGATMARIASFLMNPFTGVDRPVVDHTGLTGSFDMSIEWSLAPGFPPPASTALEETGPTFLQSLREQLGLTLRSDKGPVDVLVIDHIELPTPD